MLSLRAILLSVLLASILPAGSAAAEAPPPSSQTFLPSPRSGHSAVWSGAEMIVWGGNNMDSVGVGARYNPSTDVWTPLGGNGSLINRINHSAIWTGTEMIVWGGLVGFSHLVTNGGRYDPLTNTWSPVSEEGSRPRSGHVAFWTGSEMIIWGGVGTDRTRDSRRSRALNDGVRYDPATDSWKAMMMTGAPTVRTDFGQTWTGVWTGREMIVWGDDTSSLSSSSSGGRYDPVSDTWKPISVSRDPSLTTSGSTIWTGREMIVWGGFDSSKSPSRPTNAGGRYDAVADVWSATQLVGAPSPRAAHTAVWTGKEMIVWGGWDTETRFNDGARYNPITNEWTAISTIGGPSPRTGHTAVWTGTEMIIWGGRNGSNYLDDGGRYNPATDTWKPIRMLREQEGAQAGEPDWAIPNGHFFSQTGNRAGEGFSVTDAGGIPFWETWQRLGLENVGYPISHRFEWKGFATQIFQKAVFQWQPGRGVFFINVFDELHEAGQDSWLRVHRATPEQLDTSFDAGKSWEEIVRDRLALLDANQAIIERYYAAPEPLLQYGLPTSRVEDYGNVLVIRTQRAVFQQWKEDVPWAKAGEVTIANGGDIAKELGLFPEDAMIPQPAGFAWAPLH